MRGGNKSNAGEVLIEYIAFGNVVKVTAVDAATGREASIVGDPAMGREALARLAVRKLRYVMEKKKG